MRILPAALLVLLLGVAFAWGQVPGSGAPGTGAQGDREIAAMVRACTDMMQAMLRAGGPMGRMGGMMGGGLMPMFWWGWVAMLLVWALVAGLVVALVVVLTRRRGTGEALGVLQLRLARGELSMEEYEARRRLLQS